MDQQSYTQMVCNYGVRTEGLFDMKKLLKIKTKDKTRYYNSDGKLHRVNGPALINADGSQFWYRDGNIHRDNGPAIIWPDGYQAWWVNNKFHRDNASTL